MSEKADAVEAELTDYYQQYPISDGRNHCREPEPGHLYGWICTREPDHNGPHVGHVRTHNRIIAWQDGVVLKDTRNDHEKH